MPESSVLFPCNPLGLHTPKVQVGQVDGAGPGVLSFPDPALSTKEQIQEEKNPHEKPWCPENMASCNAGLGVYTSPSFHTAPFGQDLLELLHLIVKHTGHLRSLHLHL